MSGRTVQTPAHAMSVHCAVCVNTIDPNKARSAAVELPTSDGTICVCEEHAGLIDCGRTTFENITRVRGTDASRHAT